MKIEDRLTMATKEESQRYVFLYAIQDEILARLSDLGPSFYLTGGTALSRFYADHRYSDDLDFFVSEPDVKISSFVSHIERILPERFEINIARNTPEFGRLFITDPSFRDVPRKIEVVSEPHHIGDLVQHPMGFFLNNLEDMGVNKVTAFEDRSEIKDIVDLFWITKTLPIDRLIELADMKRIPIKYESLLAINTQGINGRIVLKKPIDAREFNNFITSTKEAIEKNIQKKTREILSHPEKIENLVRLLLWDFPLKDRVVDSVSLPVLKRRIPEYLPLPERLALKKMVNSF